LVHIFFKYAAHKVLTRPPVVSPRDGAGKFVMDERRNWIRKRTCKGGTIAFDRARGISALVKNFSDGGAMLEVASTIGIPDDFTLVIDADHLKLPCHVIWRQPNRIGVRFL
jgi:hypothetical protein